MKTRQSRLRGAFAAVLIAIVGGCSGGNSTGPAAPLPTGQTGSIYVYTPTSTTSAGCYVESVGTACANPPSGSKAVTSLATEVANSSLYLLVGDAGGNLNTWTVSNKNTPTAVTGTSTCTALSSVSIAGISTYFDGTNSYVYYASQAGALEQSISSVPCVSSTNTALSSVSVGSSKIIGLATSYNGSTTYIYGITSLGQYFSIAAKSTTVSSLQTLPGIPTSVVLTSVAADKYGYLYVTDTANPNNLPGAIYVFYSNNGTLQNIGTFNTGNFNDLNNPTAITTYVGSNGSQGYCTTGPCEFIEVANGNGNIMQLVMNVPGFNGAGASISPNEFNAPYANCEIFNAGTITAFPDATLTNIGGDTIPYVYVGQNGTKSGPCLGVTSGQSFGNGVTAYLANGE